jgi:hypothetical protein
MPNFAIESSQHRHYPTQQRSNTFADVFADSADRFVRLGGQMQTGFSPRQFNRF